MWDTNRPPSRGQTNTYENTTLRQTSFAGGNYESPDCSHIVFAFAMVLCKRALGRVDHQLRVSGCVAAYPWCSNTFSAICLSRSSAFSYFPVKNNTSQSNVMSHLHCGRRTRIPIPFLSLAVRIGICESDSVQCENLCVVQCSHWVQSRNQVWLQSRNPSLNPSLNPSPNPAV